MIFFVFYNRHLLEEEEEDNDHVVLVKNVKLFESNY